MHGVKPLESLFRKYIYIFYDRKFSDYEVVIATPIEVMKNIKMKVTLGSKASAASLKTFLNGSVNQQRNILCTK